MKDWNAKNYLRDVLGNYMATLGQKDSRVVVVNADLMGTCRNRTFVETFPERSFNVGIAEQNLIGFASGLAHEGFKPFAFSMAQFISMRACEQVRTDVAYGNLDVKLITTYAGLSGGISGATHWTIEDIGILTAMPNMVVMEPCDPIQAEKMLDATLADSRPTYIRSTIEPVPSIYDEDYSFEIGKASIVMDGDDGAFLCSGVTVKYAAEAAKRIAEVCGKAVRVVDMHTIKPLDRQAVLEAAETGVLVVAQDHNVIGGLGYHVAAVLAQEGLRVRFRNLGVPDEYAPMAHAPYLYRKYGYDADGLFNTMMDLIGE